jgi:molecular chaperone DnaK
VITEYRSLHIASMLGIDLGTTFCAVATLDEHGRPVTVPNRDGDILTPSAVYISDNTAVVGQAALDVAQEFPNDVAMLVKRRIGYPAYGRSVNGRQFRPETLSALLLKKLTRDASERLGDIGAVVITVPAYFDDTRRKATQDAGRIAGLDVLDILDEPGAAALTFALTHEKDLERERHILVYDLGGGTFDVTIVKLNKRRFQTIAISGDVRLGGHDWDQRIVDHVAQSFMTTFQSDPREDPKSLAMLYAAAERAKRTLSKLPQTTITCSHDGHTLAVPLSRTEFESLTLDLLTRTRLTVQEAMSQADIGWDKLDRALLVGGSTHMPMTRQLMRDLSGKEPETGLAVSEVVARGAALHAGICAARVKKEKEDADVFGDVVEIHVNAHGLGVEVRHKGERVNDVLIPKNTQLPAGGTRTYRTARPDQAKVRVKIMQGDARQAAACIPVGECWIEDLPSGLPSGSPVEVTCGCADNGLIEVTARDVTSGKTVRAELHREGGLSDVDIAHERQWVESMKIL